MKKHYRYLLLFWLLAIVILPLPLVYLLDAGLIDSPDRLLVYDLGLAAYVSWLTDVYLATRPKWIARRIGLPSLYMMHGVLAVLALVLAALHVLNSTSFHEIIRLTGYTAFYLEIVLLVLAILFLSGWLSERLVFFNKLRRLFKHQASVWLHRLNLLVIALIFIHVNVIPRVANIHSFVWTFDFYTVVFLAAYLYQKFVGNYDDKGSGVVVDNQAVNDQVQLVTIQMNEKAEPFQAGDFYFLSVRDKNVSGESHPFSVLNVPNDERLVQFAIHKTGDFTKKIGKVKKGMQVHLDGPYGQFAQEAEAGKGPLILYALGTGIAPLLSLAEYYAGRKELHLIWSRGTAETYFEERLETLKHQGVKADVRQHRFSSAELQEILDSEERDCGDFFIVGSAPVVLKVRKNLKEMGVANSRLHDEHLTM